MIVYFISDTKDDPKVKHFDLNRIESEDSYYVLVRLDSYDLKSIFDIGYNLALRKKIFIVSSVSLRDVFGYYDPYFKYFPTMEEALEELEEIARKDNEEFRNIPEEIRIEFDQNTLSLALDLVLRKGLIYVLEKYDSLEEFVENVKRERIYKFYYEYMDNGEEIFGSYENFSQIYGVIEDYTSSSDGPLGPSDI